MNTLDQVMQLNNKLRSIIDKNNGVVTLHFYDGKSITARVKSLTTNFQYEHETYESLITIFTDDIEDSTTYDMFKIKNIS